MSLSRWKKRKEKSCYAVVEIVVCFVLLNFRCLFDCNQFQAFILSNCEGVSSSLTNANNHIFFLSQFPSIIANKQISNLFPLLSFSVILKRKSRNQIKSNSKRTLQMQLKFRWFRSIWSKSRFIKSQSKKKKKNDDCFHFARIAKNYQNCKNEKQSEWSWNFIHCLFSWLQKRKEKLVILSNSFSVFNKQLSFILIHSTSSNQISQNHDEKRKRKWTSSTTIEQIQYPIV